MSKTIEEVAGYCLRHNQPVTITAPANVMGALYACPFCGNITEPHQNSLHVIAPSGPLLERLVKTQGDAPNV